MDGQWFRMIAIDWYDRPYQPGAWSEYPFFPLFPAVAGALMKGGMAVDGGARRPVVVGVTAGVRCDPPPRCRPRGAGSRDLDGVVRRPLLARRPQPRARVLRRVLPRRPGVGAGVRRPGALGGGWCCCGGGHREPSQRLDRRRRRDHRHCPHRPVVACRCSPPQHQRPCSCSGGSGTSITRPATRSCSGRPSRRGRRSRWWSGLADPAAISEMSHVAWFAVALVLGAPRAYQPPEWLAITASTVGPALLLGVVGLGR